MGRLGRLLLIYFIIMSHAACQKKKVETANPFFEEWTTPYGVPPFDRIRPEHFLPAFERGMSLHNAEIDAIVGMSDEPTFENTIAAYDASGRMLQRTSLIFEMLAASDATPEMQAVEQEAMPLLAAHADEIRMNERLFGRIKAVYDRREALPLTAEQRRLTEKLYRRFVRSGALLDEPGKRRLKEINGDLSRLSVKYGNNLLHENDAFGLELTADRLEGLPNAVREAAREKAQAAGLGDKSYLFTLHKPSMLPFLSYAKDRKLREELYTAYLDRCNHGDEYDNKALVNDYIRLRTEKAHLLGYDSYADYVTADQMAATPAAVYALLDEIWTPALDRAKEELAAMEEMLRADHPDATFEPWDWWYYAEKVRRRDYALDDEALRPYFTLENVQGGIFFLANRLYGITFRPIVAPLYNPDCLVYEVLDEDESHLGVLYFDYYVREGKSGGAWCGNFTEQYYENGERVAPVVGVVTNYARPTRSTPTLLNLDETKTLFHEFGHALHSLFRKVEYRGLADVEGDFVELPSQVMENWATEPEMLEQYALHYRTNDKIPESLVRKIRRSAQFNQGFEMTELLAAALSDMDIHSQREYAPFDVNAFEREALYTKRGLIPQIEPRYRYPYFSHIFDGGYSAGYYFYIWAQVLDKDAYEAFRQSGDIFNRKIARAFREKLLSRGGEADGMTLYRDFRGQDPDKAPLLKACGFWVEPEPETDSLAVVRPAAERQLMPPANLLELRDKQENLK